MRSTNPEKSKWEPEAEYLTLEAVAARTSLSRQTLYNWISKRRIGETEGLRRIGRNQRIHWRTFKRWIDRN